MKNGIHYGKRCLVLLLMMSYIFVSLTYILSLPPNHFPGTPTASVVNAVALNSTTHTGSAGANNTLRLHCLNKSVPKKKVKVVASVLKLIIITCSAFIVFVLLKKQDLYTQIFINPSFHRYQKFCVLRI